MTLNKIYLKNFMILIAFFLITIANVIVFDKAKYIGLILILSIIYIDVINHGISKNDLMIITGFCAVFMLGIPFQNLSFKQNINAIFYYITLLSLVVLGKRLFKNGRNFISCLIGVLAANIFGFIYSPSLLLSQLSGGFSRFRIYGSFSHPNALGSIIIICLISMIIYISTLDNAKYTDLNIKLLLLLLFIQVILTNSRGYIITFILFTLIYSLKYVERMSTFNKVLIYIVLSIVVIYSIYFFCHYYAVKDASYSYRVNGLKNLKLEGIRYIFGYGMVSSDEINYSILDGGSMEIAWVKLFYKAGIIGIILFILILFKVLLDSKKIKNNNIKYAFYATYFSFIVGSLVESNMITIFNANPIFMWLSLSALPYLQER